MSTARSTGSWTKERPTEPGWWWAILPAEPDTIVPAEVHRLDGVVDRASFGTQCCTFEHLHGVIWYPMEQPPELPKGSVSLQAGEVVSTARIEKLVIEGARKIPGVEHAWLSEDECRFILGGPLWATETEEKAVELGLQLEMDGAFEDIVSDDEVPADYTRIFPESSPVAATSDKDTIAYMTSDVMPCGCDSDEQHERHRSSMENVSHMLEIVADEDKMVKVRMNDGAGDGTMFVHESHLPDSVKTESTGWTNEWPTQPGWYWMFWDERTPGFEYRRKIKPVFIKEDVEDGRPSGGLFFHAMESPPKPPKGYTP